MPPPAPARLAEPEPFLIGLIRGLAGSVVGSGGLGDEHPGLAGLALTNALGPHFHPRDEDPVPDWGPWLASVLVRRGATLGEYLRVTCGAQGGQFPAALASGRLLATGGSDPACTYPIQAWLKEVTAHPDGDAIDEIWELFTEGLRELETDEDPVRVRRGQQACREIFHGLQELEKPDLEKSTLHFRQGVDLLQEVFLESLKSAFQAGPTGATAVNWTIHSLVAVADGLIMAEAAEFPLDWIEELHCRAYYQFEREVIALEAADTLWTAVEQTRTGLDNVTEAILACRVSAGERAALGQALQLLAKGGRDLAGGWKQFVEARDRLGSIPCVACGEANPVTARVCHCGSALVVQAGTITKRQLSLQLKALLLACEQLQNELAGPEEFQPSLQRAYRILARAENGLARLPALETVGLEAFGSSEMLKSAMGEYRAALDELQRYLAESKPSRLFSGIRQLVAAGRKLEGMRDLAAPSDVEVVYDEENLG